MARNKSYPERIDAWVKKGTKKRLKKISPQAGRTVAELKRDALEGLIRNYETFS